MDRFHVEINLKHGYLDEAGGVRNKEIKRILKDVEKNIEELHYKTSMILRDTNGNNIGYARYERIDY